MAEIHTSFQVIGGGSVQLPVTFLSPVPITITDQPAIVQFSVQNTLDRSVTFTQVTVTKSGLGESKLTVTLSQDSMVIPALGSTQNAVTLEPNTPLLEGESPTINIDAVGG